MTKNFVRKGTKKKNGQFFISRWGDIAAGNSLMICSLSQRHQLWQLISENYLLFADDDEMQAEGNQEFADSFLFT